MAEARAVLLLLMLVASAEGKGQETTTTPPTTTTATTTTAATTTTTTAATTTTTKEAAAPRGAGTVTGMELLISVTTPQAPSVSAPTMSVSASASAGPTALTSTSQDPDKAPDDQGAQAVQEKTGGDGTSDEAAVENVEKTGGGERAPDAPSNEASENSHFFAYLVTTAIIVAVLYIAYHNKRKIIAFALEGKRSKLARRPKSSEYQRLDQKI